MAAIRAHYATGIGGTGPVYWSDTMGSWFLENAPGVVDLGQHACLGMVQNLPHWPPYWAQVWGDIVLRQIAGTGSGTSYVELFLACSWWYDGTEPDPDADMGYQTVGDVPLEYFEVSGTNWQTFQIPVREMLFGNPIKDSDMYSDNPFIDYDDPAGYWDGPLSYWWYQQTYFPWLRVINGPSIEVKTLRLWDQATCATDIPSSPGST